MQIIGLVGEKGSGKETFGNLLMEILSNKKIIRIRFSDLLAVTLKLWDLPNTRENLQHLALVMDNTYGEGTLSHALLNQVKNSDAQIVILDGVRWKSDGDLIRSFPKNVLVYITADLDIRYHRLKKRKEKKNEAKTYEQFMREEKALNELLIPQIGSNADFKIENNGTIEDFKAEAQKFASSLFR